MNKHKFLWAFTFLLIVAAVVVQTVIAKPGRVSLAAAPDLSGAISQGLATSSKGIGFLPVVDKDYTINKIKYLDDSDWAVVSLAYKGKSGLATIIMHKINGYYQLVLGPGTAFSVSSTESMPADVVSYVKSAGVFIYEPTDGQ